MPKSSKEEITLAIETAVSGGSLALFRERRELDLWIGREDVSRSEDLLVSISDILKRNSLCSGDIDLLVVSTGPGSYTGIRVGIATALGLKNSLGVRCIGFEVLDAMQAAFGPWEAPVLSAVPLGRNEVCWQVFRPGETGVILVEKEDGFADFLAKHRIDAVLHEKLYSRLVSDPRLDPVKFTNAGSGLAKCLGKAAKMNESGRGLMPTYVRDFV